MQVQDFDPAKFWRLRIVVLVVFVDVEIGKDRVGDIVYLVVCSNKACQIHDFVPLNAGVLLVELVVVHLQNFHGDLF